MKRKVALKKISVRLELDQPWGEHMVIQAGHAATPAGTAAPGEKVTVRFAGRQVATKTSDTGRWQVTIPVPKPGGPYTFSVSAGHQRITFSDVLVGEVWLASGQSNMEWALEHSKDPQKEIKKANYPQMRIFEVPRTVGGSDQRLGGEWKLCTPETAPVFSAVAYHFGRNLIEKGLGPVGVIRSAWGGTPAESWLHTEHTRQFKEMDKVFKVWSDYSPLEKAKRTIGADFDLKYKKVSLVSNTGKKVPLELACHGAVAFEGSKVTHKPGHYFGHLNCDAWNAAWAVPAIKDWSGYMGLEITLKADCPFDLCIARGITKKNDDDWAFPVVTEPAKGWKAYRFKIEDLQQRNWGFPKKELDLSDTGCLKIRVVDHAKTPQRPGILFDAMIRPMSSFRFKGVIWYQGEANLSAYTQYGELFKSLIQGWRLFFDEPDLPFLFVQLVDFGFAGGEDEPGMSWAGLRDQQLRALELERTGVAMTLGLGDGDHCWHPKNKRPVGDRLAQEAFRIAYGDKTARGHGPRFKNAERSKKGWHLSFETYARKLRVSGKELKGFEARIKGQWKQVAAKLLRGKVEVEDPKREFEAIRYAWHDHPLATLADSRKMPAFGFMKELTKTHVGGKII